MLSVWLLLRGPRDDTVAAPPAGVPEPAGAPSLRLHLSDCLRGELHQLVELDLSV